MNLKIKGLVVISIIGLLMAACGPAEPAAPEVVVETVVVEVEAEPVVITTTPEPTPEPVQQEVTTVTVGVIAPRLALLPTLVAAEDFLPDEGVVVKWAYFQSDGAIAQALASGAIDMSVSSPHRAQQLNEAGGDARIFAVTWAGIDWYFVGVDDIETIDDLSGRTVGISSPGSTTDVLFRLMLDNRGLSPEEDNIDIVAIGATPARASALAAGRIDAAWLGFDAAYDLVQQEGYHVVGDISAPKEFPNYTSISWTAPTEYIENHPDVIEAITRAMIQANRWAQDKDAFLERAKTSVISMIAEQSEEQVEWSYEGYIDSGVFPVNGGVTEETMLGTMEVALRAGAIETMPEYEEIADDSFQTKVLDELGRW